MTADILTKTKASTGKRFSGLLEELYESLVCATIADVIVASAPIDQLDVLCGALVSHVTW